MTLTRIADKLQKMADDLQKTIDTPVPNVFDVMAQFPASATNNGRKIVLEAIKDFERCPCDKHAQKLENYGFSVDHSDRADHGDDFTNDNE